MKRIANAIASFFIGMACVVIISIGMLTGMATGGGE